MLKTNKFTELTRPNDFTPLTDIMFTLLLFFLLTATAFISYHIVSLPQAESAQITDPKTNTLSIREDGILYWNGENKSREEIFTGLSGLSGAEKESLALEVDKKTDFGIVIEIMTEIEKYGFVNVYFSTLVTGEK